MPSENETLTATADESPDHVLRRNHLLHSLEGGAFSGGMLILAAESVLPAMMVALAAPIWIVASMPVLMILGLNLPSLFTAHWVERMRRVRGMILASGFIQRLPFALGALALYFVWPRHPRIAVTIAATAPLVSGLAGGISYIAWVEFVARTIDLRRISSMFARRNIMTSLIGLSAGPLIVAILDRWPDHRGYALLYAIASGFLWISYGLQACIRETEAGASIPRPQTSLRANLLSLPDLWRGDAGLRNFVTMRVLQTGVLVMTPFLAAHALSVTGKPASFVGLFVTSQTVGTIIGSFLGHQVGDRWGGWSIIRISVWFYIATGLLVVWADSMAAFMLVFALYGIAVAVNGVGRYALQMAIFPGARRPTCLAVDATAYALTLLGVIGVSTLLKKFFPDTIIPPALVALACVLGSVLPLRKLRFVRLP